MNIKSKVSLMNNHKTKLTKLVICETIHLFLYQNIFLNLNLSLMIIK